MKLGGSSQVRTEVGSQQAKAQAGNVEARQSKASTLHLPPFPGDPSMSLFPFPGGPPCSHFHFLNVFHVPTSVFWSHLISVLTLLKTQGRNSWILLDPCPSPDSHRRVKSVLDNVPLLPGLQSPPPLIHLPLTRPHLSSLLP